MRSINHNSKNSKKILFLGSGGNQKNLIDALIKRNCLVDKTNEKIYIKKGYDLIISYKYRHIIDKQVIENINCPIINLHISYLPFNRGAHPNFWSFYDRTPAGVSIHLIDEGIDTGPIITQKIIKFDMKNDTFKKTYNFLNMEIEKLFMEWIDKLLANEWEAKRQTKEGTVHYKKDLPSNFSGWDSNIENEISRLYIEGLKYE